MVDNHNDMIVSNFLTEPNPFKSIFRRIIKNWTFVAGFLCIDLFLGLVFRDSSNFWPKQVEVVGYHYTKVADIIAAAHINYKENVWVMNILDKNKRVETLPYIKFAIVSPYPIAQVHIFVIERQPNACVISNMKKEATVDSDLRLLQYGCVKTYRVLPMLAFNGNVFPSLGSPVPVEKVHAEHRTIKQK